MIIGTLRGFAARCPVFVQHVLAINTQLIETGSWRIFFEIAINLGLAPKLFGTSAMLQQPRLHFWHLQKKHPICSFMTIVADIIKCKIILNSYERHLRFPSTLFACWTTTISAKAWADNYRSQHFKHLSENVKILEFRDYHIWHHNEKCIQISANMPSIGRVIYQIGP